MAYLVVQAFFSRIDHTEKSMRFKSGEFDGQMCLSHTFGNSSLQSANFDLPNALTPSPVEESTADFRSAHVSAFPGYCILLTVFRA